MYIQLHTFLGLKDTSKLRWIQILLLELVSLDNHFILLMTVHTLQIGRQMQQARPVSCYLLKELLVQYIKLEIELLLLSLVWHLKYVDECLRVVLDAGVNHLIVMIFYIRVQTYRTRFGKKIDVQRVFLELIRYLIGKFFGFLQDLGKSILFRVTHAHLDKLFGEDVFLLKILNFG